MRTSENAKLTLDACITLLQMSKEPLHYKTITDIIVESGLAQPYGKCAFDQIVYSVMHQDVKKNGKNSQIRFMGRGIFCFSDVDGIDLVELPKPKDNSKQTQIRIEKEEIKQQTNEQKLERIKSKGFVCGNCKYIEFFAIEEISMRRGACNNSCSNRNFVNSDSKACIEYEAMTIAKKKSLIRTAEDLKLCIIKTNIETKNSRNRDGVLK